jgi:uncharacterized protein (TIGR02996 family)
MDDMIPFLRATAKNPDDDTPRLVFADWLDEHGHHPRAEFIRLQVELVRLDPGADGYPEKTAKMRRCGVFTRKGKHRFFDYLPTKKCKIAFHRGFIETINTADADKIDTSGFDLVPLLALRTRDKLIEQFKQFTKLKWLEYGDGRDATPTRLLEVLGPKGWFKELETLSLPYLNAACLRAGVIPQFDLPKLRNFFLCTDAFYNLGVFVESNDGQDDDYGESRSWSGLPDYLPKNAIPNKKSPLERFVWHADDDSDFYRDGDHFWAGPTMESLLTHLKPHKLKQVEVAVDWDDHENGGEGVDAAAYEQNPLKLCPTLEHVTLDNGGLRLLESPPKNSKRFGFTRLTTSTSISSRSSPGPSAPNWNRSMSGYAGGGGTSRQRARGLTSRNSNICRGCWRISRTVTFPISFLCGASVASRRFWKGNGRNFNVSTFMSVPTAFPT